MKRIFTLLMALCLLMVSSVGLAEDYPAENYEMYYEGNRAYPIVFVQWGYGYVLDMHSARPLRDNPEELIADIHEVELASNRMKANPMHIYAKYNPDHGGFVIGFQEDTLRIPDQLQTFDYGYMDKGTSETGLLFPAGRALWEGYTGKPFYKKYPMLKPVNESGAPSLIQVNATTRYGRYGYNKATVEMKKSTGIEFYEITFSRDHFIIDTIYAEDEKIQERLRREELCRNMYYEDNPRVRLVANYLGIVPQLTKEQLAAVGGY